MCWRGVCTHSYTRVQAWPPAQYLQLLVQMLTMRARASTHVCEQHFGCTECSCTWQFPCLSSAQERTHTGPPSLRHPAGTTAPHPHSPPLLQQARCPPPPASRGSCKMRGKGTVRAGAELCHPASPALCQSNSYRRVLALGTVPGRLMSRSLRLAEKKERASVSP